MHNLKWGIKIAATTATAATTTTTITTTIATTELAILRIEKFAHKCEK